MSQREEYYVKKLRKEDAKTCKKIDTMFKKQQKFAEFPKPIEVSNSEAEIQDGCGSDENGSVDMVEDTGKNKDNSDMRTFYTEKYELKYQWLASHQQGSALHPLGAQTPG